MIYSHMYVHVYMGVLACVKLSSQCGRKQLHYYASRFFFEIMKDISDVMLQTDGR